MKIYVDKLPNSCEDCVFCKQTAYCSYCDRLSLKLNYINKEKDCPLQTITDLEAKLAEKDKELNSARVGEQFALKCCNEAKQQLAESKEQVEIVEKQHSELLMTIFNGHKENFELKQQLAEKENTITALIEDSKASKELLKKEIAEKEKELEEINRAFVQSTHDWKEIVDEKIKAKTEFAIQQLQKVKAFVNYAKIHKIDMINTHQLYEFMCQIIKEIEGETK